MYRSKIFRPLKYNMRLPNKEIIYKKNIYVNSVKNI
jgi:hypothetical protein